MFEVGMEVEVVNAAKNALDTHGYGMSSVRFICGTQDIHKELERKIAEFYGTEDTILYAAAFDANGGVFEPLFSDEDAIISDELNNLFPHLTIPAPTYFKPYLWEVGYHSWKSKYNSHQIIKGLSRMDGIYICGEAFSLKQGWIEGALLSAEHTVKSIL